MEQFYSLGFPARQDVQTLDRIYLPGAHANLCVIDATGLVNPRCDIG